MGGLEVKGPVWVLETIASVCERLAELPGKSHSKRLSFLFYELETRNSADFDISDLCEFFFDELGFKAISEAAADLKTVLLPEVLQHRSGIPLAVGIIFRGLADRAGLATSFIKCPNFSILKCKRANESFFVDLKRAGKVLDRAEMLELIQHKAWGSDSVSFEPIDEESILATYLNRLRRFFADQQLDQKALIICEQLLELQPKNLSVLRERSMAYYRLSRFNEALVDLKRYLSFSDPAQQPPELLELFRKLESNSHQLP